MSSNYFNYLIGSLIFSFLLHASSVAAIYCFQCNSLYDPDCANIQPNDTSSPHYKLCKVDEVDPGKEMFCRKIVQTIYDRDGIVRVIRKCGWIMHKRECYEVTNKGHEDINCQCFYDGCNAAHPSFTISSSILFLALIPPLLSFLDKGFV